MQWWHELLALGIVGLAGYLYKVLIDNRFNAMFALANKNHAETLAKLEFMVTTKECDKTHEFEKALNEEKIKVIKNDLNGIGAKVSTIEKIMGHEK